VAGEGFGYSRYARVLLAGFWMAERGREQIASWRMRELATYLGVGGIIHAGPLDLHRLMEQGQLLALDRREYGSTE